MGLSSSSDAKESACNTGDPGFIPGSGRSLKKEMATHSCILVWRIPWTKEPGRLQSIDLQRVRHGWGNNTPLINIVLDSYIFLMCFLFLLMTSQLSIYRNISINSVQLLSHVRLYVTPWTTACKASLSITNSWSLLKLMSIESIMLSNHFILCWPLLLLPSIFASIRVFSNELAPHTRWTKYWSFSFSSSHEYSEFISLKIGWFDPLAVQGTVSSLLQLHISK